jgi:DNA ligase-1
VNLKPMLAGKCESMADLHFPVLASVKLDGVRFVIIDGVVMSRSLKPIPNAWVQRTFGKLPGGTDGELIFGDPTHPDAYRNTVSSVMSEDGEPTQVHALYFDNFLYSGGFEARYNQLRKMTPVDGAVLVTHLYMSSAEELEAFEREAVEAGHEGVMVRSLNGPYKQGRSTAKEGYLLKVKRFEDSEAVVLGTYEWETNTNEATKNALGHTERSSHQAGKVGAGVLGGLSVKGIAGTYNGIEFSIGTGFSGADSSTGERAKLWKVRETLVGKIAKFKYFASGSKDKPRFPVFLGWRSPIDL